MSIHEYTLHRIKVGFEFALISISPFSSSPSVLRVCRYGHVYLTPSDVVEVTAQAGQVIPPSIV